MKVRFAVTPPLSALDADDFPLYLAECQRLGFDALWLSDVPLGPFGDPLIALAWAAGATARLKLGANVVPLARHPYLLARQLAQLDRLSRGRLLLSFVPGLGAPAERAALGHADGDRGRAIDTMLALVRRWWSGAAVSAEWADCRFENVTLEPTPLQQPLEVWFGGAGPAALERVARLADGWLTSAVTPAEAGRGRAAILRRAAELDRRIDPEHFGISVPVASTAPDEALLGALRARRRDRDLSDVLAVGPVGLERLVRAHLDAGLSKFVLRPVDSADRAADWRRDLAWWAETVLPLQR